MKPKTVSRQTRRNLRARLPPNLGEDWDAEEVSLRLQASKHWAKKQAVRVSAVRATRLLRIRRLLDERFVCILHCVDGRLGAILTTVGRTAAAGRELNRANLCFGK